MSVPDLEILTAMPESDRKANPLLFVHGAWHAAWCWQEHFLPFFAAQGYECHAVSLRGHGGSDCHSRLRWHRGQDFVRDIAHVANQMTTPPIVIGHSMGGYLVQKYLESYGAPAGILLASVPSHGVWRVTLNSLRRFPWPFIRLNLGLTLWPLMETPERAQFHLFSDEMPKGKAHQYHAKLQDESYRNFLDMMVLDLPKPHRVKLPMLVLGAENDRIFGPDEVMATAQAYNTTARIFPGMAHDMMLEKDWQAVANLMVEWLADRGL